MRALVLTLLLAVTAAGAEQVPVQAQVGCKDGKLVAVRIFSPGPGVITIPIPEDPCAPQKEEPEQEPEKDPASST